MSLNEEVEALRRVPMFSKIDPGKLKLLAFTSEKLDYRPGDDLCKQGDPGDAMFIILSGAVDVLVDTPNGELKVSHLTKHNFVGEMAILCDITRTATVRATETVTVLRISKELFYKLVNEFPQIAIEIMRGLALRLQQMTVAFQAASSKTRAA